MVPKGCPATEISRAGSEIAGRQVHPLSRREGALRMFRLNMFADNAFDSGFQNQAPYSGIKPTEEIFRLSTRILEYLFIIMLFSIEFEIFFWNVKKRTSEGPTLL